MNNIRDIRSNAGGQFVDDAITAVNQIEEEMTEEAGDAVAALQRYDWDDTGMLPLREGDYVKLDEALDAIKAMRR